MEASPVEVFIYQTREGRQPFTEWIGSLKDQQVENIIHRRIGFLRRGNFGDFKFFEGIFELRIDHGPGYRIYFGKKSKTVVILLIGGAKTSQTRDIEKAKFYWKDFQSRIPS